MDKLSIFVIAILLVLGNSSRLNGTDQKSQNYQIRRVYYSDQDNACALDAITAMHRDVVLLILDF